MEKICNFLKEAGVYYLATVDEYSNLRAMYDEKDDNTQVLYFKNGVATFSSFTAPEEVIEF